MKLNINDLSIYYEVQGAGAPVVLLHGWGADASSLRSISTLLKDKTGARVYTPDFPGFGYSQELPAAWSVDDYVCFLQAFLDALQLDKVTLLGHSFGGRVIIKFAARYPQRVERIVMVDAAGIKPPRTASYYTKVYFAKALNRVLKAIPALKNTKMIRAMQASMGSEDYRRASGALRGTFTRVVNEDLRDYLPQISQPTLLVWGEKDTETPLSDGRLMKQLIPNSRLEVIPGAGHFSFADNFKAFAAILLNFLGGTA